MTVSANKYRARPTTVDGIRFASMHEANCYQALKLREKAGEIRELKTQVPFKLFVNGVHVCTYVADFTYVEWMARDEEERARGRPVVADAKGVRTAMFRLKSKLMKAALGIDVLEITRKGKRRAPRG